MRTDRDPVPWEYAEVVRRYLRPTDRVLDVGTGGGERFLRLVPHAGAGVGIDRDPEMIRVAQENTPSGLAPKVVFEQMDGAALAFPDASFDVVLDRHCGADADEVARVLRPGGVLRHPAGRRPQHAAACSRPSAGGRPRPGGPRAQERGRPPQLPAGLAGPFARAGCAEVALGSTTCGTSTSTSELLVFHLKAAPWPEPFDPERHWLPLARLVDTHRTPRGIETNEHRTLLVVRKASEPE